MFELLEVYGIGETKFPDKWDFDIEAKLDGVQMRIDFTYSGDTVDGLSPAVAQWWAENPDAPVAPYVPPPEPAATDQSISKRQLVAALILGAGQTDPDSFIEAAIGAITDAVARALALNDWRNAPYFVRTHALFNDPDLLAAAGMSGAAIDGLWSLAVTLPR